MTNYLKDLLHKYGLLSITLQQLNSEYLGKEKIGLAEYDAKLDKLGIEKDEPVVVVRISDKGEHKIIEKKEEHSTLLVNENGESVGDVTVLELPEDYFYFFGAFREGIYNLTQELPPFFYSMCIVHAYGLFEHYLTIIGKLRYQKHPNLLGEKKTLQYDEVFKSNSKEEILSRLIDKEINELFHKSLIAILDTFRNKLGFKRLPIKYENELLKLSLIRNCLVHNNGVVGGKLAKEFGETYKENNQISIDQKFVDNAINVFRKYCYEMDVIFEKNGLSPDEAMAK